MTSLMEYAANGGGRKAGPPCWLCGIPERAEVDEAAKRGVPVTVILRWLKEKKNHAEASRSRVSNHIREHVAR